MYRIVLFSKAKIKKKHIECIIFHIKIVKRLPSYHDLTQVVGVASCYRNVLFINFLFRLNTNETTKFWQSHFPHYSLFFDQGQSEQSSSALAKRLTRAKPARMVRVPNN